MTNQIFAEIFSEALDSTGLSPGAVARLLARRGLKVHRGTLIRWRDGETLPSLDKLDVLRGLPDALGLSAAEKAEFLRAVSLALGFPLITMRERPLTPAARLGQRIHFGADDLPPFAGRSDELATLQALVLKRQPVAIIGLGGIGKTRLAQELLRSTVGYFAHGCEYLTVSPGQDNLQIIRTAAHLLGVTLPPQKFTIENQNVMLDYLRESLQGIDLLFLVDNVETADQVRDLVRELPAITWVFTARRVSMKRIGVYSLHLDLPSAEDAAAMFLAHARQALSDDGNPAQIAAAIEPAGRLPIAIRLLSSLLANHIVSSMAELEAWLAGGGLLRSGHHSSLQRLFDQLLAGLPPEAQQLFEVCGVFAARTIRTTHLLAVARGAGIRPPPQAWEWLADYSLVDLPTADEVQLHPLLHDYAQRRLTAAPYHDAVWESYKGYYLDFARAVIDTGHDAERDYRRLRAEEANLLAMAEAFYHAQDWQRLQAIWPAISGYLWNTGQHAHYEAFDRKCLEAAEALGDAQWEGVVLSELGFVALDKRKWDEAEALFRRSQALHDADAGRRIEQARLRRYRAALAMNCGRLDEAIALLAECGALLAELSNPPETRLDTALLLLYCAQMSARFRRGELDAAEQAGLAADERYQTLASKIGGHRLGEFKLELGDVLWQSGKPDAARKMWAEMLQLPDVMLHLPEHADAHLRLACLLARAGDTEAALESAVAAHQVFARFGKVDRHTLADDLISGIEGRQTMPEMDDLIKDCPYPSY